jgi:hypothetical protein
VTTLPPVFKAANAEDDAYRLATPEEIDPATAAEFPPAVLDPQVITLPSALRAAKAFAFLQGTRNVYDETSRLRNATKIAIAWIISPELFKEFAILTLELYQRDFRADLSHSRR